MSTLKVTFVIGANATGKSYFIQKHFSGGNLERRNIRDYQEIAYNQAGANSRLIATDNRKCLYNANLMLLEDIIELLQQGQNVVVEHTLFKAKRRISYIDEIRKAVNAEIDFYVMCPSDKKWAEFITERNLQGNFQYHKRIAQEIEFPNPIEGIDRIFQVTDVGIQLRMDLPNPEILPLARHELKAEAELMLQEEIRKAKHREVLDSMNFRPFWHYCEVCGKKEFCTAEEAFNAGWDYPPKIGTFGLLGPRTCGQCSLTNTLFWKVHQQSLPIVIEGTLTNKESTVWKRIKGEPESLLVEEQ